MAATSPKPKKLKSSPVELTYFEGTGRAELPRLLFTIGGIDFVDTRVTRDAFATLKPKLPLGQLPTLTFEHGVYPQSMAIARYAARVSKLYPNDAVEMLTVEMMVESLHELQAAFLDAFVWAKDEDAKAEKKAKLNDETLPKVLGLFESRIQGKFLLGDDHKTLADVCLFDTVENTILVFDPAFDVAKYPKIETIAKAIKTLPSVAKYLAARAEAKAKAEEHAKANDKKDKELEHADKAEDKDKKA